MVRYVAVLLIALSLFVIAFPLLYHPHAGITANTIRFDSSTVEEGQPVTVNVTIDNVVDLAGIEFSIAYDSNLLQYENHTEGTFLNESGAVETYVANTTNTTTPGVIEDVVIVRLNDTGVDGAGLLFSITFLSINPGTADINFTETLLANSTAEPITMQALNQTLTITASTDTTAPVISGAQATAQSATATVNWTTDEPANSTIEYGNTTSLGTVVTNDTYTTAHSIQLTALNETTLYHYNITSCDAAGNCATQGTLNLTTQAAVDTIAPTVSITSPANASTVSGTTTITATAGDDQGVASVQFVVDTATLTTDTTTPYSVAWDASAATAGTHTITAIATDTSGNNASHSISVTVQAVSTGGSSGGGGGGGGGGGFYLPRQTTTEEAPADEEEPTVITVTTDDLVEQATIALTEKRDGAEATIEYPASEDLQQPPAESFTTYRGFLITAEGFTPSHIITAQLTLAVPTTWIGSLAEENSTPELRHYTGDDWEPIALLEQHATENSTVYTADVPGIGAYVLGTTVQAGPEPINQTQEPETQATKTTLPLIPIVITALVIALVAVGVVLVTRQRKSAPETTAQNHPETAGTAYVKQMREAGHTDKEIREALTSNGWTDEQASEAIKEAK